MDKQFFAHPNALVESAEIGSGTRVWAFAHILPGAKIGSDCNICDHTFIENDVVVGDRVTIKCGVQLWDGLRIEDDVFIGPNATFTNDAFPRSKHYPEKFLETRIRKGASIGANATILPGLTIGRSAMIGASAVVTRSVPTNAIVVGNPARIVGYVDTDAKGVPAEKAGGVPVRAPTESSLSKVKGVRIVKVPLIHDLRGDLIAREIEKGLPFIPKRFFIVIDVPSKEIRGEHAHHELEQLLVCLKGSVSVLVDDGKNREELILDSPEVGLYIPPRIWAVQYKYSSDAVLFVAASDIYKAQDYIRDYDEFLRCIGQAG